MGVTLTITCERCGEKVTVPLRRKFRIINPSLGVYDPPRIMEAVPNGWDVFQNPVRGDLCPNCT